MFQAQRKPALFESILHPTDFSAASERAFAHALALALTGDTRFTLLHVGSLKHEHPDWKRFPAVRGTLERWGLLEPGSPRTAVFEELRVRVEKVVISKRSFASAVLAYLEREPFDLVVLATEGREGVARWLKGSRAEAVARVATTMTLFVPARAERDFVSVTDGNIALGRVLVPVDQEPPPNRAIEIAKRMAETLGSGTRITLVHVAEGDSEFPIHLAGDGDAFERMHRRGDPVEQILDAAASVSADLIVMPTAGHHGVFDAFRGSTTERVLRRSPCPVLAVPSRLAG